MAPCGNSSLVSNYLAAPLRQPVYDTEHILTRPADHDPLGTSESLPFYQGGYQYQQQSIPPSEEYTHDDRFPPALDASVQYGYGRTYHDY